MATELKMRLLFRRDTAANLTSAFATAFLPAGEPVYETDTGLFKIGDGKTAYDKLPFANEAQIKALIKEVDDKFANYYTKTDVDKAHETINTAIANINTAMGELDNTYATDAELADAVKDLEAADTAIENKIGAAGDAVDAGTVYGAIAAEKARAEGIESGLDSRLEAAEGKLSTIQGEGDGSIKKALADAKTYTDGVKSGLETSISNEETAREQADSALGTRIDGILDTTNATSLASRVGAAESDIDTLQTQIGALNAATTFAGTGTYAEMNALKDIKAGAIYVVVGSTDDDAQYNGHEFVYDGENWVELGSTTAEEQRIGALEDAIGDEDTAASILGRIKTAEADIDSLETRMTDAESDISDNASAITALQNGKLDAATFTAFNNGTSKSVSAIEADIVAKANAAQAAAESTAAKALADAKTAISGEIDADVKALADGAVAGNTDAIAAINDANSGILAQAKSYADTEDATTLEAAKDYTDSEITKVAAKAGVSSIVAGTDIVVTPDAEDVSKVTVAHKAYNTGTLKDANHDSATNPSFITSVTIDNGHVTNATVQNLATVLSNMEFILDGGSATENTF